MALVLAERDGRASVPGFKEVSAWHVEAGQATAVPFDVPTEQHAVRLNADRFLAGN
jgi:hypothetical protein